MITIYDTRAHEYRTTIINEGAHEENKRLLARQWNRMDNAGKGSVFCGAIFGGTILAGTMCLIQKCWANETCNNCSIHVQIITIVLFCLSLLSLLSLLGICCKRK